MTNVCFALLKISQTWDHVANPQTNDAGITPEKDDFRLNIGLGIDY